VVILQAVGVIKPEARERWLGIIGALTGPTLAEEQCLSYHVAEEVGTPNTFVFLAEWTSPEALYAHFRTPWFADMFAALGDVLAEPATGSVSDVSSTITLAEAQTAAGILP